MLRTLKRELVQGHSAFRVTLVSIQNPIITSGGPELERNEKGAKEAAGSPSHSLEKAALHRGSEHTLCIATHVLCPTCANISLSTVATCSMREE